MTTRLALLSCLFAATVGSAACGGDSAVVLGTTTVGTHALTIKYEGDAPTAGVTTNFVIKPDDNTGITKVVAWVGSAGVADSAKVTGDFDSGDGDYDNEQTIPDPLTADDLYYFTITADGSDATGSIAFQGK